MIRRKQRSGIVQRQTGVGLILFLLLLSAMYFWWTYDFTDSAYGKFIGKVTSTWNDDERDMTLERDFEYNRPARQALDRDSRLCHQRSLHSAGILVGDRRAVRR
jgi:hypothetical protein